MSSGMKYGKIPEGLVEGYAGPGRNGNNDGAPKRADHYILPAKPDPRDKGADPWNLLFKTSTPNNQVLCMKTGAATAPKCQRAKQSAVPAS